MRENAILVSLSLWYLTQDGYIQFHLFIIFAYFISLFSPPWPTFLKNFAVVDVVFERGILCVTVVVVLELTL